MDRQTVERDRLDGFISELNLSGFPNREIARQCGLSHDYVERRLRGKKSFVWKISPLPPLTRPWRGGGEAASQELKQMREVVGKCLWSLWNVKAEPSRTGRPGRPAAVRPHQVMVEQAVHALALACDVTEARVWRWIYPGRVAEIYRSRKKTEQKDG